MPEDPDEMPEEVVISEIELLAYLESLVIVAENDPPPPPAKQPNQT